MTQIVHCHSYFPPSVLLSLLHWLKSSFRLGQFPITLQTFAVGLVAAVLKPREATLAATLYLILGAIGLPVLQVEAGDSKPSLDLQLAICLPILFLLLSHQY